MKVRSVVGRILLAAVWAGIGAGTVISSAAFGQARPPAKQATPAPGLAAASASATAPASAAAPAPLAVQTSFSHGLFRDVLVSRPLGSVQQFVLLLSGEAAASRDPASPEAEMARAMTATGAMVATIDVAQFMARLESQSGDCTSPVGAFENLSHHLQAEMHLPTYLAPLLVGRGANGALAYAMLAQAPADVLGGALSIDFCPELRLAKPLCIAGSLRQQRRTAGEGVDTLLPAPQLAAPWIALAGDGKACPASVAQAFVGQVAGAKWLPSEASTATAASTASTTTSTTTSTTASFTAAYAQLAKRHTALDAPPASLADLPIVEVPAVDAPPAPVPASGGAAPDTAGRFAVLVSGDGGWAGIDKALAARLAAAGMPVVGLDSLRYFWSARTPEGLAADLDRVVRYYAARWKRREVVLIGYSQGADVLPFAFNRLPPKTRAAARTLVLLGPGQKASFEFHVSNWIGASGDEPVAPEAARLKADGTLCVYGLAEKAPLCPLLAAAQATVIALPGDHHFNGDYARVATLILEHAGRR